MQNVVSLEAERLFKDMSHIAVMPEILNPKPSKP